jgi:ribonuclease HI
MAGRSDCVSDAFHAELNAAVEAVRLAEQLRVIHAIRETDSQRLMMALNKNCADSSPLSVFINDLKFYIRTKFAFCGKVV